MSDASREATVHGSAAGFAQEITIGPHRLVAESSTESMDDIIRNAVSRAMASIVPAIERQLDDAIAKHAARSSKDGARGPKRRARIRADVTRWVADRRARRVSTFVIEMTGGLEHEEEDRGEVR